MFTDKSPNISLRGNKRLLCAVGAASLCFLLITYLSIPTAHKDAVLSAISSKASLTRRPTARPSSNKKHGSVLEAASNRTLGLDSIVFLNLPHRHDRYDAMAIQAHLSGIEVTRFPAVAAADVQNDQGMPPTQKPGKLKDGEKGCWRAHANVWQHMLEKQIPAVLVLESDAGWDVNLRPIMGRLNGGFRRLLQMDNPDVAFADDPDDPWLARSGVWDLLSLGHCIDTSRGNFVVYDDPHAPSSDFTWGPVEEPLNQKRVVFRAKSIVCTTGYLVSLTGAARLLVRSSFNLDDPVDVMMAIMTEVGQLRTYAQQQRILAQWEYIDGIGKSGSNSDIKGNASHVDGTEEGWDHARALMSTVQVKQKWFKDVHFRDFALGRAWQNVFGDK
ncbi:hypothetical protein MGG_03081 [Pyricularia oryzae 70-15]|uniref:Glycosyl transferase family 25 domain-containing protein n=3 Tax=Pyricularia oryzae TaxID=318829 RepID=G5EHW8_PYRO7|nr:uncharacterized protein MGG_03081 [Pyricularia oryzae 70-15]ELQ41005.1 hypothetical protein OOU_Y34scaffold00308g15 [Pyricularia oryzae Y34]KAI7916777.1 hypothetical protein M9X92_007730 [Pyricularia oryzae]EAQ71477.1 hypothetical protein MGCH7_ch7g884 [Pyricularia oryzae 70-15]EHA45850.1 hypothetical protein MGG_03081 [Pyricularia oryzae 70-15]KAI7922796.1 hypothetical protein M0657_005415 [Pyricularia oryzae]